MPLLFLSSVAQLPTVTTQLWYNEPSRIVNWKGSDRAMNETLLIGDSRLGALIFGEPERENLVLNESSLWTGDENPSGEPLLPSATELKHPPAIYKQASRSNLWASPELTDKGG